MLEVKSKATSKSKAALLDLVFVALFAAVMTVCAQIQIPFGEVPFTLQTLGVFIAASLLGWKRGTLSVIVYVLLGLAGVPVFAGFSGGIGVLFGPTGGYLIGFIAMALIGGIVMEVSHRKLIPTLIGWFIGTAVDYLLGTLWFMYIMHTTFMQTMAACVFPFIIGDCIKMIAGVMLGRELHKILVHAGFIKTAVA